MPPTKVNPANFKFTICEAPIYCQLHPSLADIDIPSDTNASNAAFVQLCNRSLEGMRNYPLQSHFERHILVCKDGSKLMKQGQTITTPGSSGKVMADVIVAIFQSEFLPGEQRQHYKGLFDSLLSGLATVVGGLETAVALAERDTFETFWNLFLHPSTVVTFSNFVGEASRS